MDNLNNISNRLIKFRDDREWSQFHTPKNLVLAMQGELGELSTLVQWKTDSEVKQEISNGRVQEEMADIFIYLLNLANTLNIDLLHSAQQKIVMNEINYPVEKSKGNAKNKDEL